MTATAKTSKLAASELLPIDLSGVAGEQAHSWLKSIALIRQFETTVEQLVANSRIPGGMHSAIGQEATAVGVISALEPGDIVAGTHRSHHITLAKAVSPRAVMAELYGKATGCVGGRGGHMHLADPPRGHYGANGIVGAGLGLALGAALASSVAQRGQVAVGFFGDGGANTGRVWEFVNLASLWKLPLLIICENNLYAVETPVSSACAGTIAGRAEGFGLPVQCVDGQDVAAVHRIATEAVRRARIAEGPTFIEALTYRHGGHDVGDRGTYRSTSEVEQWRAERDPLARLIRSLLDAGLSDEAEVASIQAEVTKTVADSVEFAESSPYPDLATYSLGVTGLDTHVRGNR